MSVYDLEGNNSHRGELEVLQRSVRDLSWDIDRVRDDVSSLEQKLRQQTDETEERLGSLETRLDDAEEEGRNHDRELKKLRAVVERLGTSVAWLERRLRASGEAPVADLDSVDPALRSAARTAETGRQASLRLMSDPDRAIRHMEIRRHQSAVTASQQAGDAVLAACTQLASLAWDAPNLDTARTRYTQARTAWTSARHEFAQCQQPARQARQDLEADDQLRSQSQATIRDGQRAWETLTTRLRTHLVDALGDTLLLPTWLAVPLGPMPPATRTSRWIEVATEILAYRVTYDVRHALLPLGEMPPGASSRRRAWATEIKTAIEEFAQPQL